MKNVASGKYKSKSHTDSLHYRLKPFMAEYGDWMAANVSTEIIDDFLTAQNVAAQTKLHYRRALHQVFGHAVQLRATPSNPVKDSMKPKGETRRAWSSHTAPTLHAAYCRR